jgi:hypothetical protein
MEVDVHTIILDRQQKSKNLSGKGPIVGELSD